MITSVITGDIINSRGVSSEEWLPTLKEILNQYGAEPKQWEIYRGDSFQLEVSPDKALKAAIHLKANIKQFKSLDARMAIGIGEKDYDTAKITESNGEVFIYSGEAFEMLGKKRILSLTTPWNEIDIQMSLYLDLASLTMNNWKANTAGIFKAALENPGLTQKQLAKKLKKNQSTISESLNRAGFEEIMYLEKRYRELIANQ